MFESIFGFADTKSSFADWLNNQNVRNQLKLDIKICLVKNGYPPQYSPEVFNKVMEQQRLSCGEKIFVMSSYQTIGAGQNLQYKILKGKKVVQLGEFTEGDKRFLYKDFDALYLGNITNMTVNTYQDETITSHDLLQMLFQIEELYENGEMNYSEKDQMLKLAFRSYTGSDQFTLNKLYKLKSVVVQASRMVLQAVGRMCRTYIVQHITEEAEHFTNTKGSSPDIKKIVQELIIKGDVRERMISIFDWERLDSGKDWTFVLRKKIKTKYGENAAHINHVNKKALNYFQYYRLEIDCNGEMKFDTFCDSNQDEAEEWNKICYAYDFVEDKHRGAQNPVEGLMYSDIDNIHAILLTREKTLPNISALMNTLMETDAKERVSKELLLEAIDDFEKDNIDSRECISEWKSKVAAETEMITKKAMKKILNMRTGIASKFNRFLHEKYGVWIDGELRKGEFEATYQIGNLLNIKYEYNEKDYLDGRTFVYYVGAKSKRLAYPNACCMRKVISLGEELEYEEALPLMAVEFVRNSQYTVLPFPFKYLREYIEQC